MLYLLWDLGLKVGHATRSVDECMRHAERDITIRTALLEARYLWGDRELFDELRRASRRSSSRRRPRLRRGQARRARRAPPAHGRFALRRRAQRQGRQGRPARPAHAVLDRQVSLSRRRARRAGRQGRADPEEARQFERAERFLSTVRCHLHYLTGRPDDRLSFDLQREIAARLGYRPTGQPRRRALHEALLSSRQDGGRPDAHLLRRARGQPPAQAQARAPSGRPCRPRQLEGFQLDGERLAVAGADAFAQGSGGDSCACSTSRRRTTSTSIPRRCG